MWDIFPFPERFTTRTIHSDVEWNANHRPDLGLQTPGPRFKVSRTISYHICYSLPLNRPGPTHTPQHTALTLPNWPTIKLSSQALNLCVTGAGHSTGGHYKLLWPIGVVAVSDGEDFIWTPMYRPFCWKAGVKLIWLGLNNLTATLLKLLTEKPHLSYIPL